VNGKGSFWRGYLIPAVICCGVFYGMNWVWNHPVWSYSLPPFLPYALMVYLVGGSGVALLVLAMANRAERLSTTDLGLGPSNWTAPRRLLGLAVIVAVAYGGFATMGPPPEPSAGSAPPTWGEYCFWYLSLLSASQAELLVFLGAGFCLLRRGLERVGWNRVLAAVVAAVIASVAFGLYHYTYEPRWHAYAFSLMPEMLAVLLFFLVTRNFFLTLLLHNALAALGFTYEAHSSADPVILDTFAAPLPLTLNLISFVVPFLLLHALELWGWAGPTAPSRSSLPE
jgi:hypothetical protein